MIENPCLTGDGLGINRRQFRDVFASFRKRLRGGAKSFRGLVDDETCSRNRERVQSAAAHRKAAAGASELTPWALERIEQANLESQISCDEFSMAFQRKTGSDWHQGALPGFIEPELPTPVGTVPSGARWIHEIKFDGYGGFRIIKNLCSSRDGFPGERYLSSSG